MAGLSDRQPRVFANAILLRDRIVTALGRSNEDIFKELSEIKGFPSVLRQVLDESQTSPTMIFVENTAIYMSRHLPGDEPWKQNAWESISQSHGAR